MKSIFFVVLFFYGTIFSIAQTHAIGFRVEPFLFMSKTESSHPYSYKLDDEVKPYLTSFNFLYKYKFSDELALNTSLGYLWTNKGGYNGAEITEFVEYSISSKSYLLSGVNFHLNESGTSNQFTAKGTTIPLIVIGAGLKFSRMTHLELQYQIPLTVEYKTSMWDEYIVSYKLSGIIKLSFGLEWEL